MITYEQQGKIFVVTGTTKDDVNLTVPSSIDGNVMSKIEANSFTEMAKLKKVIIPGSIKVIGAYSFASCPLLKEVIIEEGVEVIEDWAFISCNIDKIKLPKSIKSIGKNAFLGNLCKFDIDEEMKSKDQNKGARSHTNNRTAVFPLALMEAKNNINSEIIESRSKYIDSQLDLVENGGMLISELDVPFLFNHDEFLVSFFSKKEIENIKFDIDSESKTQIGLYAENDPDFLLLKINLVQGSTLLSSFYIKTPYLEDISIENVTTEHIENKGIHYYFINARISMLNYGNGNINREFALNLFNDFTGKYQTELNNGLINEEQFNDIKDTIDAKIIEVMDGFLSQIDGAPLYTYALNLLRYLANDDSFDNKGLVQNYIFEHQVQYYNELTDYKSLEKICFVDVYDTLEFIKTTTGMSLDELNKKYDISLTDASGMDITEDEAKSYQNIFVDLETNYIMHGDFLLYIYKELQRLNNQFSVLAFSA